MQLFASMCILLLSIVVYYMFGKAFCIRCRCNLILPEVICTGFFLYFAFFQIVAEAMILTKQKLHVLGLAWLCILLLLTAAASLIIWKDRGRRFGGRQNALSVLRVRPALKIRLLLWLMAAAVFCECASAVLMQRSIGWDFAYYIGNMTTSVATDTMYIFDGSSGLMRNSMELRYALSSFYMNTAWISQMTGVSALVLQKYTAGVLCVLLTNAVVYSFAMEVFDKDRGKAAALVTLTVILTIFWDVYDTSAQFLLLRNYEAKAYCANVVLPMVCFLLYRIWKNSMQMYCWAQLFVVSFASVAVSMSSLVLVPALIVLMLSAHLLTELHEKKQWSWIFVRRAFYCLLPNICYLLVYFSYTRGWLILEVS